MLELSTTSDHKIVMYGFENRYDMLKGSTGYKAREIIWGGSKEELLDMDREWMKDIVQWVPFVNCYYVYNYVEKDMDFNMDTYKESLESALSTLKESNYILITKEILTNGEK